MAKFLDSLGLARVRDWVRANFAAISHSHVASDLPASGVNAGSYGPGADASPAHADSFSVPCITFDAKGRATAALNRTITLPAASQGTIPYGVCSEAANVAAKTVTVSPAVTLANRTLILVAMSNSNTAANPTLNVNGLGAKPIWTAYQKTPGTTAETSWAGGQILLFQYNGSEWRQITQPVQPSIVTGIKGNSESSYRTGQVNLTAANIGAAASGHTHSYIPLSGGTITGQIQRNPTQGTAWVNGRDGAPFAVKSAPADAYTQVMSIKTSNGSWEIGTYNWNDWKDILVFSFVKDSAYNAGTNTTWMQFLFRSNGTTNMLQLLWTNSSPNSSFSAQSVSVPVSNYSAIIIVAQYSTDSSTGWGTFFLPYIGSGDFQVGGKSYLCSIAARTAQTHAARLVSLYSTTVNFSAGYNSSNSQANGHFIPHAIYGLR